MNLKSIFGFISYLKNQVTPEWAYQNFVQLFCMTNGRSNDRFSKVYSWFHPPYSMPFPIEGVLGKLNEDKLGKIAGRLKSDGFFIFENRLAENLIQNLLEFSLTHFACVDGMDEVPSGQLRNFKSLYQRGNPKGPRYSFSTNDLLDDEVIQFLMSDLTFVAVAQAYLNSRPTFDVLSLWWLTSYNSFPQKQAAQWYHFDLERIKWLKFFIFLTDVTPENGPHAFIKGTQRSGKIPKNLLLRGYSRLSDEEIRMTYEPEDIIEFACPRGTIIAEDTRGLHKGGSVLHGDRLVLQLQLGAGLFGTNYPRAKATDIKVSELKENILKYPDVYRPLYGDMI